MSKSAKIIIGIIIAISLAVVVYFLTKKKTKPALVISPGILPKPEERNTNVVADLSNGSDPDIRYTPPPSAVMMPQVMPSPSGSVSAPVANTTIATASTVYTAPKTETVYTAPKTETVSGATLADPIPADGVNVLDPQRAETI